jgi:hypothetical protein
MADYLATGVDKSIHLVEWYGSGRDRDKEAAAL